MELTELRGLVEIIAVIGGWLAANKGIEFVRRKRHANGNGTERRRNSFAESDKTFVKDCFDTLALEMVNGRLVMTRDISKTIQEEAKATRAVVRKVNE